MFLLRFLSQYWQYNWFKPSSPDGLGLLRIVFYFAVFDYRTPGSYYLWGGVDPVFWMPISYFKYFDIPVLSVETLSILQAVWRISLVLCCIGLLTRINTIVAFVLGGYLMGLPQNFGKTDHSDSLLILILGILAFSRCGDAWSLDRVIRSKWRGRSTEATRDSASGEYTWPVQLGRTLFVLLFFAAGVSKLRHGGLEWIFSENMSRIFIYHYYISEVPLDWGLYIAKIDWLCKLIAAGTVGIELTAPLALFNRRARLVIIPGLLFMQIGILYLLGFTFVGVYICYLFWLPWDKIARWIEPYYEVVRARMPRFKAAETA